MPTLTPSILTAQVKATLAKTRGGRPLAFRCPGGWDGPPALLIDDRSMQVRECRSDLEAREALTLDPATVLLLVHAPDGTLAQDTMARVARGRLLELDEHETLLQLAGAHTIDPRLLMHREVVSLLVQRWRPDVRLTSAANVVECGRAFAFLLHRDSLATEAPDLFGLLLWSLEDGMNSVNHAPAAVQAAFFDWLRERNGTALNLIASALKDHPGRLVSLGLALGVIFPMEGSAQDEARDAKIRLERHLGDIDIGTSPALSWHRAAKAVMGHKDERLQREILRDTDLWLEELRATDLTESSAFSPKGYELRLDALAAALLKAHRADSAKSWEALVAAEQRVAAHWLARLETPRMEKIRMALRLTRWIRQEPAPDFPADLAGCSSHFLADGAYVDWARQKLRRGDGRDALNKAYAALLSKVDDRREETNTRFARALHHWCSSDATDTGVIPIEDTIQQVLVPLAKETRVLLLVMDGMSGGVFAELMADLMQSGWHTLRSAEDRLPRPVIAALPCITEVSRAALFRGRLDAADTVGETVNFREHPALHRNIQSRAKPQLFLKASLADTRGAGLSAEVREAILEQESRVVSVVINAIDDQLSTMGQLSLEWTVKQISWLKELLDAAAGGQRAVIIMSDHGHVPDKETDRSLQLKTAAGDRHRSGLPEPREGEMAFSGPRLLAATGTSDWIFSQSAGLRYKGKKAGYHGGVADQEMIVPMAILSSSPKNLGPFEAFDFPQPGWWSLEPAVPENGSAPKPAPAPGRKKKPAPVDPNAPELWAVNTTTAPAVPSSPLPGPPARPVPSWIALLLGSEVMKQQKGHANRTQVSEDQIARCLALLDSKGGVIPVSTLGPELNLLAFRVGGFVATLQRLLNVEGYPVLELDASQSLRLNRDLLFTQFDIKP